MVRETELLNDSEWCLRRPVPSLSVGFKRFHRAALLPVLGLRHPSGICNG